MVGSAVRCVASASRPHLAHIPPLHPGSRPVRLGVAVTDRVDNSARLRANQVLLSLLNRVGHDRAAPFHYGARSIDPGGYLPVLRVSRVDPIVASGL